MFETADTDSRFHDVDNLPKWTRQWWTYKPTHLFCFRTSWNRALLVPTSNSFKGIKERSRNGSLDGSLYYIDVWPMPKTTWHSCPKAMLCQEMELYFMKVFVISCKLLNPFNSCSELLIVINPYLFLKLIVNSTFNADCPFFAAIIKFHTMSIVNPSFFPHELCCKNYEIRKSGNLVIPWIPDFLEMFFWLMELELEHSIIIKKCQSIFWFSDYLHSTK